VPIGEYVCLHLHLLANRSLHRKASTVNFRRYGLNYYAVSAFHPLHCRTSFHYSQLLAAFGKLGTDPRFWLPKVVLFATTGVTCRRREIAGIKVYANAVRGQYRLISKREVGKGPR
jgi:hypothetical protein